MKLLSIAALTLLSSFLLSVTATKVANPEAIIDETLDKVIDFDKSMDLFLNSELDKIEMSDWFRSGLDYAENTILIDNKIDDEVKSHIKDLVYDRSFDKLIKSGKKLNHATTKYDKRDGCNFLVGAGCELMCGGLIAICEIGLNAGPEVVKNSDCLLTDKCRACYIMCYM